MDDLVILKMAVSTLNTVEVHGEENLISLLGVINALKTVIEHRERSAAPPDRGKQNFVNDVSGPDVAADPGFMGDSEIGEVGGEYGK